MLEQQVRDLEAQLLENEYKLAQETMANHAFFAATLVTGGKKYTWRPSADGTTYEPVEAPLEPKDLTAIGNGGACGTGPRGPCVFVDAVAMPPRLLLNMDDAMTF